MKRAFLSFLLASILFSFTTLAGMAIFGMHGGGMMMGAETCISATCHDAGGMETSGAECLEHCLSATSTATAVVTPLPFALIVLIAAVAVLVFGWSPSPLSTFNPSLRRWREGIGKLLLQQNLSTVILRD
jgi:hypothetical protein